MVAEAHLMVVIFLGFEQGNLKSCFYQNTGNYDNSYSYIKETGPHHVAMVSSVKDVVIMDWRVGITVGVLRVPVGGLLWNQPVLGE